MNKRFVATFLWFNVGWTAGAMGTYFLGLPDGLSWVVATVTAAVIFWDPAHLLWTQRRRIVKTVPTRQLVGGRRVVTD